MCKKTLHNKLNKFGLLLKACAVRLLPGIYASNYGG
jgi:hypothetical protein